MSVRKSFLVFGMQHKPAWLPLGATKLRSEHSSPFKVRLQLILKTLNAFHEAYPTKSAYELLQRITTKTLYLQLTP